MKINRRQFTYSYYKNSHEEINHFQFENRKIVNFNYFHYLKSVQFQLVSQASNTHSQELKMNYFIHILFILIQIILSNSEKYLNKSELFDVDYETDLSLGFYEIPQKSHYEEGGVYFHLVLFV